MNTRFHFTKAEFMLLKSRVFLKSESVNELKEKVSAH